MTEAAELVAEIEALGEKIAEARQAVGRRFIGQDKVVDLSLTALLCGGHGLLVGLPLMLLSAICMPSLDMDRVDLRAMAWESVALMAGILMSLGYAAAIVLAMRRPAWRRRLSWWAPAGRMALTNYLMQSLVCTSIFYGYGLGYFEALPRAWQPLFVVGLFALQVLLSRWWLARYRHGWLQCDPVVAQLRVSGVFQLDRIDHALDGLSQSLAVRVERRTRFWTRIVQA